MFCSTVVGEEKMCVVSWHPTEFELTVLKKLPDLIAGSAESNVVGKIELISAI